MVACREDAVVCRLSAKQEGDQEKMMSTDLHREGTRDHSAEDLASILLAYKYN